MTTAPKPNEETTYPLRRWTAWPNEVDEAVEDFYERRGVLPNALVASTATFRRMDVAACVDRDDYAPVGGMCAADYELTFLVNERVPDRHVWLTYEDVSPDDDPRTLDRAAA